MPSLTVSEFSYAALLYPDGSPTDSGFVAGTLADEKLTFSFTRPENPNGDFTLEILAFKGTEKTAFSRSAAILSGSAPVKVGTADTISISKPVPLEVNPSYTGTKGTVSLKVQVPDGCTLEIDDTEHFALTGTSPNFTVKQAKEEGIEAGAHPLTLTVKKGGSPLYVLSEHINVLPGLCTDTWDGCKKGEPRVINEESFFTTVYVRGTGGWYEGSPYASTATASENNFGSFLSPLDTIQKAVDKVLAMNDGTSEYTIYVDGTLMGANAMARFSALDKDLTLTIKALSGTATLDADKVGNVVYLSASTLKLTLQNLVLTGGSATYGGGVCVYGGSLTTKNCEIRENTTNSYGGGVYINGNSSKFTMEDGSAISGNEAQSGGGVYVYNSGKFTMEDGEISGNTARLYGGGIYVGGGTFIMSGGTICGSTAGEGNEAQSGGGVYVASNGTFTMNSGEISGNTATSNGGGVYVTGSSSAFAMTGGTIGGTDSNTATYGGGVYVSDGSFKMSDTAKISGNEADDKGGGIYIKGGTPIITGGTISKNKTKGSGATSDGGGIYVEGSALTMTGGTINENYAARVGGAICIENGESTAAVSLESLTITENEAGYGGGGIFVCVEHGTFTMKDCTIDKNSGQYGGGIYIDTTTFIMEGGSISNNVSEKDAGGFYNAVGVFTAKNVKINGNKSGAGGGGGAIVGGTFTMQGSTSIDENNAQGSTGGGVYISSGTFNIEAGTVAKNSAQNGGGVYIAGGSFNMSGSAEVSGNTATNNGGGVYVTGSGSTFTMSGSAKVSENNDVRFANQQTITVTGALTAASPVAVITPSSYAEGTQVLSASGVTLTQAICDKFAVTSQSNGTEWEIQFKDTQGVLKEKKVIYLNSSSGNDTNTGTTASTALATLTKAIELYETKGAEMIMVCATYTLPSGETNLLDHSGGGKLHLTLSRYESFTGNMLEITQGNVTISNVTLDGNKDKVSASGYCLYVSGSSTTVTFGSDAVVRNNKTSSSTGSGISIYSGTFKMIDGSLVEENQASYGGGVYVNTSGKFEMSGGIISGNKATSTSYGGGGVYIRGTAKMSGGEIIGNTASKGGGVYVAGTYDGDFTMTGGKITGNTATSQGGGVYFTGTFTQEGGTISGNSPDDIKQ